MDMTNATPELFAAISAAQGGLENASKSSLNPHFKSKYADLAELLNTCRVTLSTHGLSIIQAPSFDGSLCHVMTTVAHAAGGWVSSTASCVPAKSDAPGIGAATTYLRRYGLAAMVGIAQEDDDGQSARHEDKPEPITKKDTASAKEYIAAIASAPDDATLTTIAADLAKSGLPASLLTGLRKEFTARKKELTK